jgi:F0F1-type ATP synthase membrane subunit b/b'
MAQSILVIMQLVLSFGNICILLYALYTFLNKPHNTLESRVNNISYEIERIKSSLQQGNDRFKEQDAINATFKSVMISFVDFEIAYCIHTKYEHTEDLINAKNELQRYLARR